VIVLSVLYPAKPGAHFDFDYYMATHIPLVREVFGAGLTSVEVQQPMSMGDGSAAPYVCMAHLRFESPEAMATSTSHPRAPDVMADVANFTGITPMTVVSAVR
jgi:uncharacterized protein (TIGR02118 family)